MAPKLIYFFLNISLLFAILIAPSILMLSVWYRKNQGKPVFVWPKPEMVLLTIVFFVVSLMLFIVGVSCFFTHYGYLDPGKFPAMAGAQFLNLGLACMFTIAGMSMVYLAVRRLLVQMVMENGLMLRRGILPFPNAQFVLNWNEIVDYYVVPDYPNVSFTFIIASDDMKYERRSIKVPIYLKEDFQSYLDKKIYSNRTIPSNNSGVGNRRRFSEN